MTLNFQKILSKILHHSKKHYRHHSRFCLASEASLQLGHGNNANLAVLLAKYPPALSILAHCWRAICRNYDDAFCFFSVLTTALLFVIWDTLDGPKIILCIKTFWTLALFCSNWKCLKYCYRDRLRVGCGKVLKVLPQKNIFFQKVYIQYWF